MSGSFLISSNSPTAALDLKSLAGEARTTVVGSSSRKLASLVGGGFVPQQQPAHRAKMLLRGARLLLLRMKYHQHVQREHRHLAAPEVLLP